MKDKLVEQRKRIPGVAARRSRISRRGYHRTFAGARAAHRENRPSLGVLLYASTSRVNAVIPYESRVQDAVTVRLERATIGAPTEEHPPRLHAESTSIGEATVLTLDNTVNVMITVLAMHPTRCYDPVITAARNPT